LSFQRATTINGIIVAINMMKIAIPISSVAGGRAGQQAEVPLLTVPT
jgi:hypothetical protein